MKKKLPPKVHEKHGRYFYVDKNKWTPLCRVSESPSELHRALAKLTGEPSKTLLGIFSDFTASRDFAALAESTRRQYKYFYFGRLNDFCGDLLPHEVEAADVAQYLQKRKVNKKGKGAISGNRERAALSSAYEWAMRHGKAKANPCRGIRRNPEKPSKVAIKSADLSAKIDEAPVHFAEVMQLAYLTGIRAVDLRALKLSNLTAEGIEFTESKTGKHVVTAWTPTLRELVDTILKARTERMTRQYANKYRAPRPAQEHDYLLTNRFGKPLTVWGVISNMRRLDTGFQFKAIRAKAQTDGGERNVLGHTGQMREVYTRRRKLVPVR
jgi:integrase